MLSMIMPVIIVGLGGIVCIALTSYAAYERGRRDGIDECRNATLRDFYRQQKGIVVVTRR